MLTLGWSFTAGEAWSFKTDQRGVNMAKEGVTKN